MTREMLLWQIRWLIGDYAAARLWWAIHDPIWTLYERALESGDWSEYRAAYEVRS